MATYHVYDPGECPEDLFRFRYDIYVEEMGRPQLYARHDLRTIRDYLDETGRNVVARVDGQIAACVRINILTDGDIGPYREFYRIDPDALGGPDRVSICTRLMVAPACRRTAAPAGVMRRIYDYALDRGVRWNFIDCNRHLIGFFDRFGYRRLFDDVHDEYGEVSVMRLDLLDGDYLKAQHSPFYRRWRARAPHGALVAAE